MGICTDSVIRNFLLWVDFRFRSDIHLDHPLYWLGTHRRLLETLPATSPRQRRVWISSAQRSLNEELSSFCWCACAHSSVRDCGQNISFKSFLFLGHIAMVQAKHVLAPCFFLDVHCNPKWSTSVRIVVAQWIWWAWGCIYLVCTVVLEQTRA